MARIAIVQCNPQLGQTESNLRSIESRLRDVAAQHVQLAVFPECTLSGYVYESFRAAAEVAEPVPGPSSSRLESVCRELGLHAVVGMLEMDGDRLFNTAILFGPHGIITTYRKTHTLCLGVDRFTTPGDRPFEVIDLPFGRVGILICYDLRFPESARALTLLGAQAIVLPTNWPVASAFQPDVFTRARAAENRVFVLAANRVGEERGAQFLGRSQIVGPDGVVTFEASAAEEQVHVSNIDLSEADVKNVIVSPGIHEMDCIADRRADLYSSLSTVPDLVG